jgi:hypothetical protein
MSLTYRPTLLIRIKLLSTTAVTGAARNFTKVPRPIQPLGR